MKKLICSLFAATLCISYANADSVHGVHGNWGPQHNTKNFRYVVVKGDKDYFKHKRNNRTVGTKCKRGEIYKKDYYKNGKDACIRKSKPTFKPFSHLGTSKPVYYNRPSNKKCYKYSYKPAQAIYSYSGVHGNWGPQHNTKKFRYVVVKGDKDYFKHKKKNRTVGTKCKRGEGSYKIDAHSDGRDACAKVVRYTCPTGYSKVGNRCRKVISTKNATLAVVKKGVHGNWGPQHNTKNFRYVVVKGDKDYFKHKKNNRTVGTKCKRGEGTYKKDAFSNGKDACVKQKYVCPSGYSLN